MLVGYLIGILAVSLTHAAGPAAGETVIPLRVMSSREEASFALSSTGEDRLPPMDRLPPLFDECFMLDYDLEDDNSSATPWLTARGHFLLQAPIFLGFNGLTHTCLWSKPTHYLVRPHLLIRL
jgi:hypothetical protein